MNKEKMINLINQYIIDNEYNIITLECKDVKINENEEYVVFFNTPRNKEISLICFDIEIEYKSFTDDVFENEFKKSILFNKFNKVYQKCLKKIDDSGIKSYTILRNDQLLKEELIDASIRKEILEYFNNLLFNNKEYSDIAFNNIKVKIINGTLKPRNFFTSFMKPKKFTVILQNPYECVCTTEDSIVLEFDIDEKIKRFFEELNLNVFSLTATNERSRDSILSAFKRIQNLQDKSLFEQSLFIEVFEVYSCLYPNTFNFDMKIEKIESLIK